MSGQACLPCVSLRVAGREARSKGQGAKEDGIWKTEYGKVNLTRNGCDITWHTETLQHCNAATLKL